MDILAVLIVVAIVIFSMVLHELAHGVVAYWLGDRTAKEAGRLSLNPLKHLDPVMSVLVPILLYVVGAPIFGGAKPVPIDGTKLKGREWGMAGVAIAGPIMNFLIALVAFLVGHFSGALYGGNFYAAFLFTQMVVANLGFMIFNLIPIAPLDGSRVVYAVAPDGVREIMARMEPYGIMIIYILILICGSAFSQLMRGGINGVIEFFYWIIS